MTYAESLPLVIASYNAEMSAIERANWNKWLEFRDAVKTDVPGLVARGEKLAADFQNLSSNVKELLHEVEHAARS